MKHWTPRIADAAEAALATGADVVVGLVLAPHYSRLSIAGYRAQLEEALAGRAELGLSRAGISSSPFIDAARAPLARDATRTSCSPRTRSPRGSSARATRTKDQLEETARLVARARRRSARTWSFSFQSESPTGEPWLGPDILDHLGALHGSGVDDVLVCPDRLRLGPPRDPLGHRRRGAGTRPRARDASSSGSRCRTPTLTSSARSRSSSRRRARGTVTACPVRSVVDGVSRRFRVYPRANAHAEGARRSARGAPARDVWALRDVSFAVEPGEAVGLVGRNGSGKTTLLRLVSGIIKPTEGRVEVGGRIGTLLELGAGFHPDFTGRENVFLNGSILGLSARSIRERFDEIVAFAELEQFIDLPVRTYSSGMFMRLGFAVAAHLDADVLLLDEVFAVGDEAFQRKCFGKIFEFKQRGGTIVFVSHDASAVERLCERAVLLREGERRVRRADARGDRRVPRAARRRARPGRARGRPARVGQRRGADRRRPRCSARTARSARSSSPASRSRCGSRRRGATVAAAAALVRAARRGRLAARGGARRHRASSAGRAARGELSSASTSTAAARRRALPPPRSALADAAGEHLYHWLDDARAFVVYPDGRRARRSSGSRHAGRAGDRRRRAK